jgi:hypothetical protein
MLKFALLFIAAFSLSSCAKTVDSALKGGGVMPEPEQIKEQFTGQKFNVHIPSGKGTGSAMKFTFFEDKSLGVDGGSSYVPYAVGGNWRLDEEKRLCMKWPAKLFWNGSGHCFIVVMKEQKYSLFDNILMQQRFILTKM